MRWTSAILLLCLTILAFGDDVADPFYHPTPEAKSTAPPLETAVIQFKHRQLTNLSAQLKAQGLKPDSPAGTWFFDTINHQLIVRDYPNAIATLRQFATALDKPLAQIHINAYIIEANEDAARELGIQFGLALPHIGHGQTKLQLGRSHQLTNQGKLSIGSTPTGFLLDLEIQALETEGRARIMANPHLQVSQGETAHIVQGKDIPYRVQDPHATYHIAFKQAALGLSVTPHVLGDGKILMAIQVSKDGVIESTGPEPTIDTRELKTRILLKQSETLVLGGIYEAEEVDAVERTPILSDIPWVGEIFTSHKHHTEKREILVFIQSQIHKDKKIN